MRSLGKITSSQWCFWAFLGIGAALRLWWAFTFDPNPVNDGKWYLARSTEIAAGLGYRVDGQPTAYWPVGYPAVLASAWTLFGNELLVMRLLQAALGVLCLFATHQVALVACNSVLAARAALLLLALYPTDVAYVSVMLSESSYNAWMMAGSAVALSSLAFWPRTLLAGSLFALAALTKPQGLVLPVVFGLLASVKMPRRRFARILNTLALCAAMSVALSPWWILNAYAFGAFVPVSNNGGVNLFIGNNPQAHGGYRAPREKVQRGGRAEYQSDRQLAERAREYVRTNPARTVRLWKRKLEKLFVDDQAPYAWSRSMAADKLARMQPFAAMDRTYYWTLLALGSLGCLLSWWPRTRMPLAGFVLAQVLTVVAVALVYFGADRYHHAVMPWVSILAGHVVALVLRVPLRRRLSG